MPHPTGREKDLDAQFEKIEELDIETKKYAELMISLSTDFLMNKINFPHYKNMVNTANENIQNL
jgi:hypothetical protein